MARRKKSNGNFSAFLVWASGIVILVGLLALIFSTEKVEINSEGCLRNSAAPSVYVLYLDISDPLTVQQQEKLYKKIRLTIDEDLPTFGKFIVYFSSSQSDDLQEVYSRCKPQAYKDKSFLEQSSSNKRLDKMRYNSFEQKLLKLISGVGETVTQTKSPILENLDLIVARNFPSLKTMKVEPDKYKILIVSDLLQNSKNTSVFKNLISPEATLKKIPFAFTGKIEWYELVSAKYYNFQTNSLMQWWYEVFRKSGAIIGEKGRW